MKSIRPKFAICLLLISSVCHLSDRLLAAAQLVGDDLQFPYQALVLSENAPVRSGPGQVHYATGNLQQGSTVEVYRHDPGGWCAIRPPRGSFSLIPATAVEVVDDSVGEVVDGGTQAWIGTQLGPVDNPLWQIKLKAGESVELLGEANWPDPAGHSSVWYQIAPPAGEFRWVQLSDIQLPPQFNQADQANSNSDWNNAAPNFVGRPQLADSRFDQSNSDSNVSNVAAASYQSSQTGNSRSSNQELELSAPLGISDSNRGSNNSGWRQATRPIEKRPSDISNSSNSNYDNSSSNDDIGPIGGSIPREFQSGPMTNAPERFASNNPDPRFELEQLNNRPTANLTNNSIAIPIGSGYSGGQLLTPRMTELELRLNQEMLKEPNQWRLIDLQSSAESIAASTTDPLEQLQTQRLLGKLENCRQLRASYLDAFRLGHTDVANVNNDNPIQEFSLDTIYDAHGFLNELVRNGGTQQSTFVLQDANGKITHHISPGPGMNLGVYLKQKVGIIGKRGYHTELKLNHVTAERVVELK